MSESDLVGDNVAVLEDVVIGQNGATFNTGGSITITPPSALQSYTDATVEIVFTLGTVNTGQVVNIFQDDWLSQSYFYKNNDSVVYHIDDGVFDKQNDNFEDPTHRIELPYAPAEYHISYRYDNDTLDVEVKITNMDTGENYVKRYTAIEQSKLIDGNALIIGSNSNNGLEYVKEIMMYNRYLSDDELQLI